MADEFQRKLNVFAMLFVGVALISAVAMIMTADLDDFKIHYGDISQDQATSFIDQSNLLTKDPKFKAYLNHEDPTHKHKSLKKGAKMINVQYKSLDQQISDVKSFIQDDKSYQQYMDQLWSVLKEVDGQNNEQISLQHFNTKLASIGVEPKNYSQLFELSDMNHSGFVGKKEWENFAEILRDTLLEKYQILKGEKHVYKLLDQAEQKEQSLAYFHYISPSPL